jgi:methylated-DNA-[protein]-cysteine S-methyltransferase
MTKYYSFIDSCHGQMLLLSNGRSLTGCYFVGQKHCPEISKYWTKQDDLEIFVKTHIQLDKYFKGILKVFDLEYIFAGSPLQKKVWAALTKLQYGERISYKGLACAINAPKAIRAVASAVGHNPLTVIIPCHRVIGSDGTLKGYAAGLKLKQAFLNLEKLPNTYSIVISAELTI